MFWAAIGRLLLACRPFENPAAYHQVLDAVPSCRQGCLEPREPCGSLPAGSTLPSSCNVQTLWLAALAAEVQVCSLFLPPQKRGIFAGFSLAIGSRKFRAQLNQSTHSRRLAQCVRRSCSSSAPCSSTPGRRPPDRPSGDRMSWPPATMCRRRRTFSAGPFQSVRRTQRGGPYLPPKLPRMLTPTPLPSHRPRRLRLHRRRRSLPTLQRPKRLLRQPPLLRRYQPPHPPPPNPPKLTTPPPQ